MMRPLIITPDQRADADRIIEYAKANPYYVGDSVPPGSIPQHVLSNLGVSPQERTAIYHAINARRAALELELEAPDAYDIYLAKARVGGFLPETSKEVSGKGEAKEANP